MYLKQFSCLPAFAFLLSGVAAHADTSFVFTLDGGSYPPISTTAPDSYAFDSATGYYETSVVPQQIGNAALEGIIQFNTNTLDLNSKDEDISTTEAFFDGMSFLDGTYGATLSNDYPERLTGIPLGQGLPGTLVVSTVTPEPSSLLLLGTGLAGVCGMARRRFVAAEA